VVPFRIALQPGIPIHEQVAFAAKKAIMSGMLRPGDAFPSVRTLSKAAKIHANTAQKVISQLIADGLLEARPGIGTVVAQRPASSRAERTRLLTHDVEQLTVEALRLGLSLEDVQSAIAGRWRDLAGKDGHDSH
jgi:DNA-binding transcriptional regulator YhcF (GntR family)